MRDNNPAGTETHSRVSRLQHRFGELQHKLLFFAHQDLTRTDFLCQACRVLIEFSGCDALEVRIAEKGRSQRCRAWAGTGGTVEVDCGAESASEAGGVSGMKELIPEAILEGVMGGDLTAAAPFLTRGGSIWTGDAARPILLRARGGQTPESRTFVIGGELQSLALIPFPIDAHSRGVLQLGSRRREFFNRNEIQLYEAVAETFGAALAHQAAQWALRERIKELTCLYGVAKATRDPDRPVEDFLQEVVDLLPSSWQYPEITAARITLAGRSFSTPGFQDYPWKQSADIVVNGVFRGRIEVVYSAEKPVIDEGPFLKEERSLIDAVAETIRIALAFQTAQWALKERVKEITCLYEISKASQDPDKSVDELLRDVVALVPAGWQYPEITRARITFDDDSFSSGEFQDWPWKQTADIQINGLRRGGVEVAYMSERPVIDEGPFLKEERSLINEIARQLGMILERREIDREKARLEEQLRHADRLATIGQLTAGAAHELNEPLGSVLGFAQLAKNCPGIPEQAEQDITKIINAALHAREIIKKLMLFSRQMPTHKSLCSLNKIVREGLYFLETRCQREGIRLVRDLDESQPEIIADSSQLHQVLVNLVVNAIQAMPRGGTLTIGTRTAPNKVTLDVEDTGVGMSDEVMKQLFIPFFTTKGVGHGTGLGLSVVHGIVTAHGGTIRVTSQPGRGSVFTVVLPAEESTNE